MSKTLSASKAPVVLMSFIMLAALLYSGRSQADIYRAVDQDGRTVYTDVKPTSGRWVRLYAAKTAPAPARAKPARTYRRYAVDSGSRYADHIQAASLANNVDAALIRAVITAESGYNPHAVSRAGAVGLMQLMPGTASRYNVANSRDPEQNIHGGTRYLRDLLTMFNGDKRLALAAYNAGEQAVMKYGNRIPPYAETIAYVPKVLKFYENYRNGRAAAASSSYSRVAAVTKKNRAPARVAVVYLSNPPS